ncbi:Hint domain-containing protein [uncultured Lentibacter sp.]|uniref:Hint domain-containing protein n=1 Tax=uncultured Lentibacter sp. TaxID=1659309 RepID=UPI0026393218|nr:Hint domain-containing protein [uncultured Lentibacter sp.]
MKPFSAAESAQVQIAPAAAGIPLGSVVLTLEGALPVEFLTPGDRVITRDTGMAILRSVDVSEAECDVVFVGAAALGPSRPDSNSLLAATQKLLVRDMNYRPTTAQDQAFFTARELVNGSSVRETGRQKLKLFKLNFDSSHVVYVNGLELAFAPIECPLKTAA